MARFVERSHHDWWSTILEFGVFVAAILVAVLVVLPWRGFWPTMALIVAGLWTSLALRSRRTGYVCAKCRKVFQVPTLVNFFAQGRIGKNADGTYYSYKTLTCPHCGTRTKARLVKRVDAAAAKGDGKLLK